MCILLNCELISGLESSEPPQSSPSTIKKNIQTKSGEKKKLKV